MINAAIYQRVKVIVSKDQQTATLQGQKLEVHWGNHKPKKPGSRYLYLRFSIMSDKYYLTPY